MASNPIQMIEPERVHSITPQSELKVDRFAIAILDTISAVLGSVPFAWILNPSQDLTDIPPWGTVLGFVVFALALIVLRLIIIWSSTTRGTASLWQY